MGGRKRNSNFERSTAGYENHSTFLNGQMEDIQGQDRLLE